jgi:hypothetical protein
MERRGGTEVKSTEMVLANGGRERSGRWFGGSRTMTSAGLLRFPSFSEKNPWCQAVRSPHVIAVLRLIQSTKSGTSFSAKVERDEPLTSHHHTPSRAPSQLLSYAVGLKSLTLPAVTRILLRRVCSQSGVWKPFPPSCTSPPACAFTAPFFLQ